MIPRWSAAKCARIYDRLRETVVGQTDDPEHLLDVLIAAWEEMHREAQQHKGAVEERDELRERLAGIHGTALGGLSVDERGALERIVRDARGAVGTHAGLSSQRLCCASVPPALRPLPR